MDEQKQIASLHQEKQKLLEEMSDLEKKHKPRLVLDHIANYLIKFAKNGLLFFSDGIPTALLRLALRLPLILILIAIKQEVLFVLIGYVATHLICLILGKILSNWATKLLDSLDSESHEVFVAYLHNRYDRHDILGDYVIFDDGVVVNGNEIKAPMRQKCTDISIYRMDTPDEYNIYFSRKHNSDDSGISINQNIASTKFNDKFGIIADKGKELAAITFLSPSLQLKMINAPEMFTFKQIKIADNTFTAIIGDPIPSPAYINVYKWRPFTKYLKDIDKYCIQVRKQADTAYENLTKIDFILGK